MDNINEHKNYTMSKLKNKQITLNYLKNNNIPHIIQNNTIVSFPQTSPDFENLYCKYTKCIHQDDNNQTPIILIHNY